MKPAAQENSHLPSRPERRRPGRMFEVFSPFSGEGRLEPEPAGVPTAITVEATNAEGELAFWLDDFWWTELLARFGEEPVTLFFAPSPEALLHPVVLHHVEMIFRVASRWRTVAYAYRDDVGADEELRVLATSAYHEVRILDIDRPDRGATRTGRPVRPVGETIGRVRAVQQEVGAVRPVLVRMPAAAAEEFLSRAVPRPVNGLDRV